MEVNKEYPHKVSYNSSSEHKSLYSAYLKQEGDQTEYIRCSFVTLYLQCELVGHSQNLDCEIPFESDGLDDFTKSAPSFTHTPRLNLIARIGRSDTGGWYRFSFFGSSAQYEKPLQIDISTIEAGAEAGAYFYGSEESHDDEFEHEEVLGISIGIPETLYKYYLDHLLEHGSRLQIRLKLSGCAQCFAEWSPVHDEARVIKYLDYRVGSSLQKESEIPETFYNSQSQPLEFSLSLIDRVDKAKKNRWEETLEDYLEDDDVEDDNMEEEDLTKTIDTRENGDRLVLDHFNNILGHNQKLTLRWMFVAWTAIALLVISVLYNA